MTPEEIKTYQEKFDIFINYDGMYSLEETEKLFEILKERDNWEHDFFEVNEDFGNYLVEIISHKEYFVHIMVSRIED